LVDNARVTPCEESKNKQVKPTPVTVLANANSAIGFEPKLGKLNQGVFGKFGHVERRKARDAPRKREINSEDPLPSTKRKGPIALLLQ